MKILIINTFYFPNIQGGTENSIKILAENLVKNGHEVAIYCIDTQYRKIVKEDINGVKVYRKRAGLFNIESRMNKSNNKIIKITNKIIELWNFSVVRDLKNIYLDFKPDVIHTNNLYGISPIVWRYFRRKNIKIIHTLRDYWLLTPDITGEVSLSDGIIKKTFLKLYQKYFMLISKNVDIVTAPSNFTLEKFRNKNYFSNANYRHVNNAIEIDYIKLHDIIKVREKIEDNIIGFIFIGSINKNKGIDILLEVFNNISNSNITLTICGEGPLQNLVEEYTLKDKRIKYKGKLDKTELEKELIINDVLIIPSMWNEPFGRVVIEANQFAIPVIGSNRGGIKEIIETTQSGVLFSTPQELSEKILYFSERHNIKKYFKNIENNLSIYSIDFQIKQFCYLYSK